MQSSFWVKGPPLIQNIEILDVKPLYFYAETGKTKKLEKPRTFKNIPQQFNNIKT